MRQIAFSVLSALGLLAAGGVEAQVVKCVDARGAVTYAAVCPPGTTADRTIQGGKAAGPSSPAASAPPPKSTAERDAAFRKRQLEQQEAEAKSAKQAQDEQNRQKNCETAQAHLRALETGQRMRKFDPKTGEGVFVQDDERPAEIANAKKSVDSWCK